jgi:Tol biopolymer transport system component
MHYMNEFSPWSPDGSRLLIAETVLGEEKCKLYVLDVNEGRKTLLVDESNTFSAISWSPDGQRVALRTNDHQPYDSSRIFLVNADGTNLREITKSLPPDEPVYTSDYHWSPDGGSFSFVAFFQKANSWAAYETRLNDASLIEHVTTTDMIYGWWNGTYLVNNSSASAPFEWIRPDGSSGILNPTEKCEHIDLYQSDAAVKRSPNGNWIITGQCANSDTWLYWANSDGTQTKRLLDAPISITDTFLIPVSWSDDDKFVVFTTNSFFALGDLYILNVSEALNDPSTQPVKIPNSSLPSWQPVP